MENKEINKALDEKIKTPSERKALREEVKNMILNSSEVQEILDVSRARLTQLGNEGKLVKIKFGIYLKDDVIAYKHAFDDARANKGWLGDFE